MPTFETGRIMMVINVGGCAVPDAELYLVVISNFDDIGHRGID